VISIKSYLHSLRRHPGVPVATIFTIMGFLAGLDRPGDPVRGAMIGAAITSICWPVVLWTAAKDANAHSDSMETP
jgi:hypothetical protein